MAGNSRGRDCGFAASVDLGGNRAVCIDGRRHDYGRCRAAEWLEGRAVNVAGKAIVGWPATVVWAAVIYYCWSSGKVDLEMILELVK